MNLRIGFSLEDQETETLDYFVKYIPIAFHSYDGAITAEQAEAAFMLLQEQMLGTGIVPCRAEGSFYNEWDNLQTEDPVYDNPLYFQAMQAVELAGTPAVDVCATSMCLRILGLVLRDSLGSIRTQLHAHGTAST